jgi:hypothetical protein
MQQILITLNQMCFIIMIINNYKTYIHYHDILVHCSVELVQESVSQVGVVHQVPLSPGVVVRAVVAGTWEVQPLGVT